MSVSCNCNVFIVDKGTFIVKAHHSLFKNISKIKKVFFVQGSFSPGGIMSGGV